ncbi:MAG: hypothetical protein Q7S13_00685 [Candidatus Omnitrophota bacterium]|nr:hypothetical protein [Candidatus Omnitrophota bacterium]
MRFPKQHKFASTRAQTAIELAIFGAILIFVVGLIVNSAMNTGYSQNQQLKGMRLAMRQSYLNSQAGNTSRNTASVFFIEDRLVASADKYSAIDRTPMVMGGQATHSKQLFQPVDINEFQNLPKIDWFINGKHFVLTTAAWRVYTQSNDPECANPIPDPDYACAGPFLDSSHPNWDDKCATKEVKDVMGTTVVEDVGCILFYTKVYNTGNPKTSENWCNGGTIPCDDNLPVKCRFDLDQDTLTVVNITSDNCEAAEVDPASRKDFAWQWFAVHAIDKSEFKDGKKIKITPLNTKAGFDGIDLIKETPVNDEVDVDGDNKEERIYKIKKKDGYGLIRKMIVLDAQGGDIDPTYDDASPGPEPGFTRDVEVFTFVKDDTSSDGGTYLRIEEGKLYDDNQQYIRSTTKKDQVDIIERVLQLSNDTKRFCSGGAPTPPDVSDNENKWPGWSISEGILNPVEACASTCGTEKCFSDQCRNKICFDEERKIIFVRSRIKDLHGRKWITAVEDTSGIDLSPK